MDSHEIRTITHASVLMIAAGTLAPSKRISIEDQCVELLRKGESGKGGWGPFVKSPPEVFDTALALLGLVRSRHPAAVRSLLLRGRAFLIAQQQADGSWIETTRPPGAESYAQRISTCGWAALALIATRSIAALSPLDEKAPRHGLYLQFGRDRSDQIHLERPA